MPFERSDGDLITLWIIEQGDSFIITDEGETYGMLYLSNIDIERESRKRRVDTIKERFGLENLNKEVRLLADENNLGSRIVDAVQAVQALSYLTFTRRQYTQTDFRADVRNYLKELGLRFDSNPMVSGMSEEHRIDFSVRGQTEPTYLQAHHAEDSSSAKTMATNTMYKFTDIREMNDEVFTISVMDDEAGEFGQDAERILDNWSDLYVPWSQKDRLTNFLTT
jgi:hypothetical protein